MHNKLRQPDFNRHRNQKNLSLLLSEDKLDICQPFAPWALPDLPTWQEDPYGDDTWGLYYHSLGWLVTLDYGADQATDARAKENCESRLKLLLLSYLDYLENTADSDLHRMTWFDHATAWRASAIAYLYERHFKYSARSSESERFRRSATLHADKLLSYIDSGRWDANNHGIFHAEALWDLSQVFGVESFQQDVAAIALRHMQHVFSGMIDFKEGVCREQSIYYHLFDASLLADSARYMDGFGIEVIPDYPDILRRMLDFYDAFHPQGEFLQPVGDTQFDKGRDSALLHNIRESAAPPGAEVGPRTFGMTSYPGNGYYMFHTPGEEELPGSFAMLIDKPFHGAHGHADGGSFLLSRGGEPFFIDSGGPYAYGKKLRFNYFKAAEAHNVAVFGERSHAYLTKVTATSQDALSSSVRLETVNLDAGTWKRSVVALRTGVFLLIDQLEQTAEGPMDILFHLAPEIVVERGPRASFVLQSAGSNLTMKQVSNVAFDVCQTAGESGFPRGLITRRLGAFEASPVLCTRINAHKAWVVTVLGGEPDAIQVHTLYGGKSIRVLLPGALALAVDCNLENTHAPVRVYSFRPYQ